jgi:hypothetical protein
MPDNRGRTLVMLPDEGLSRCAPDVRETASDLVSALREHVETLKGQLAGTEARAEAAETRADRAIAEFSALADRLATLAADRARPWWRRRRTG